MPSFPFGVRLGIFITILASTLSAVSVIWLLTYVVIRKIRRRKLRRLSRRFGDKLDASPFILLMSLVVADLVQAIGGMPNWRWMLDGQITEHSLCTFQGLFLNVGNVAIAFSILSIAFHTFFVLILQWKFTRWALRATVACTWCITGLIVGVCNRGQDRYYGDTVYWCWIRPKFNVERIVGEYLWLWISFFIMIGLYVFMFLVMRGIVRMPSDADGNSTTEWEQEEKRESKEIAYLMLFYPAVYLVCIAPVSVSRWVGGNSPTAVPAAAVIFSNTVFSLSGFFNVLLFTFTRPTLVKGSTESLAHSEDVGMRSRQDVDTATGPSHGHCHHCHHQGPRSTADEKHSSDQTSDIGHAPSQSSAIRPTTPTNLHHMMNNAHRGSHKLEHGHLPD